MIGSEIFLMGLNKNFLRIFVNKLFKENFNTIFIGNIKRCQKNHFFFLNLSIKISKKFLNQYF